VSSLAQNKNATKVVVISSANLDYYIYLFDISRKRHTHSQATDPHLYETPDSARSPKPTAARLVQAIRSACSATSAASAWAQGYPNSEQHLEFSQALEAYSISHNTWANWRLEYILAARSVDTITAATIG